MGDRGLTLRHYRDSDRAASYSKRTATTRAEMRVLRRLLRHAGEPDSILDVPCGNGRMASFLRERAGTCLLGCDGAVEMLRMASPGYGGVFAGDAGALPLREGAVDLVVCMRLLHHFPRREERVAILRELGRASRGIVVVSFYDRRTLEGLRRRWRRKRASGRIGLARSQVRRDLLDAGLRPLRTASLLPLLREQTLMLATQPCRERAKME